MVGKRQAWVPAHGDHLTIERSRLASSLAAGGRGRGGSWGRRGSWGRGGSWGWEIAGTSADVDQLLRENNAPLGGCWEIEGVDAKD